MPPRDVWRMPKLEAHRTLKARDSSGHAQREDSMFIFMSLQCLSTQNMDYLPQSFSSAKWTGVPANVFSYVS
jgi:hypothetical protein